MLRNFRSVVDDPIPRFSSIGAGTSAVAPSRRSRRQHRSPELHRRPRTGICPTTIPLKRNGDVDQQPQRRPGGSSRSVCLRAPRESARLARARDGSEDGERFPLSVLRNFRSVVDDPIPRFSSIGAGTSAVAPSRRSRRQHRSPELHRRPRTGICPTTIPLKRNGDVDQQPQRRPGGSSRSVCLRAPRELARLARARDGSEDGERRAAAKMVNAEAGGKGPIGRAVSPRPRRRRRQALNIKFGAPLGGQPPRDKEYQSQT